MKNMATNIQMKIGRPMVRLDNEFLQKYRSALRLIVGAFGEEKPDYIIALSRKGPLLLELLRLSGLWSGYIPVISEKALDFMPIDQLHHKKLIVFDDIIISGTSIRDLLLGLISKYQVEVVVVCLAIDIDTIALERDENGNYWVALTDGRKVPIRYKVPLKQDDRFIFCNEIVRSFALLNKPYDIDYPIFYTHLSANALGYLLTQTKPDQSYNLTTVHQDNNGFSRYTFLPTDEYIVDGLCNSIVKGFSICPQICKVRGYVNNKTREAALVSMVTFGIDSQLLGEKKLFSDPFSYYDELVENARLLIDPHNETQAIYRLIWYVVCYLYGLSFSLRNMDGDKNFMARLPSDMLNRRDLLYIFGPIFTKVILHFLDLYHVQTIQALKDIQEACPTDRCDGRRNHSVKDQIEQPFDESREELYKKIAPYIKTHIESEQSLTDRIAAIFEGLYYCQEIPVQDAVRKGGIKGDEYKRLGVGFNHAQIKEILRRHQVFGSDFPETDLGLSLAFDFLVDAGIVIPIFYYERSDGFYERAYRYGEDALSARKYGYLIASTMKSLFDYVHEVSGKQVLPKIAFEKTGVLLQEEIGKSGVADLLKELLPAEDREIVITPYYSRHGKILNISDEAYERSRYYPDMFTGWCEKEGIVSSVAWGVGYSDRFFEKLRFSNGYAPKLISADKVAIFESLAMLLYQIDQFVDKEGHSDYLIALTACGDRESYLWALREELRLFFKSKDYSFSQALGRAASYLRDTKHETKDVLDQALIWCNRSISAAHGIRHKRKLREDIRQIISAIEKYFNGGGAQLRLLYDQNLMFHIEKIKVAQDLPLEPAFERLTSKVELLGEFCILLVTVLEYLLKLSIKTYAMRVTKDGGFHATDVRVATNDFENLRQSVKKWNMSIQKEAPIGCACLTPITSPAIGDESFLTSFQYSKEASGQLLVEIVPMVRKNYERLEKIYDRDYSLAIWRDEMNYLFPGQNYRESIGMKEAIEAAEKCQPEDNRLHPKVGVVIIKDGLIVCTAYRGEKTPGNHAEYTALFEKATKIDLRGATLITTLEPCTSRKHDNKPCALHIVDRGIKKVIVGMIDPNPDIRGKGILFLQRKNIQVDLCSSEQQGYLRELNKEYWDQEWTKYKIDIMKDLGSESQKQITDIRKGFYSPDPMRIRVFDAVRTHFTEEEVKTLCNTYLNMDYDDLEGKTKTGKIDSLVSCFARIKSLDPLLEAIGKYKPSVLSRIQEGDLPI